MDKYFKGEEWEGMFDLATSELKLISKYTGLSFKEIMDLGVSEYLLYRKEAWIANLNKSEAGRELLKTLWRLKQTKPDTHAIQKFNSRKGVS